MTAPTREDIASAVLDAIAAHAGRRPDLDEDIADLGIDGRLQAVIEVELEDRFGRPIPIPAEWTTPRQLTELVAAELRKEA